MTTIGFIGDVHGCIEPLRELVGRVQGQVNELVFLGDYVNRGKHSAQVLDFILELRDSSPGRVHLLKGNHDEALLNLIDGAEPDLLLQMGGAATIRSYVPAPYTNVAKQLREAMPQSHIDLLRSLRLEYRAEGVLGVHDASSADAGQDYLVAGHAIQTSVVPLIGVRQAFIDTGCGTLKGGRLTCLLWPSLDVVQVEHGYIDRDY